MQNDIPRYNKYGTNEILRNDESILNKNEKSNILEKELYGNSTKWFYIEYLIYNEKNKDIKIKIYPNGEVNHPKVFLFTNVSEYICFSDDEQNPSKYPQQIIGIDYYDYDKRNKVVINCDEAEYSFFAKGLPKRI